MMRPTILRLISATLVVAAAGAWPACAAPLFADQSVLDVTIEAPLTSLMKERPDEEYLNGLFYYTEPDGTENKLTLKLRTRGNYRRDPKNCSFAPIRLNFKVGELGGTIFGGQDKLKLVTHCRTHDKRYEQLVAREYFAYRILNQVTPVSYGVRMFRITYIDTETDEELRRLGFVIEDDEAVARRNDLHVVKVRSIKPDQLDPTQQNLVHLFEYMIGNTEYSFTNPEPDKDCCHNVDVLSATGEPPYLPLPFDFDFSGLVNAPYAQPNPRYPIPMVRVRYYKGTCGNNELLPDTVLEFRRARETLDQMARSTEFFSGKSRRSVLNFLKSFYWEISNPKSIQRMLVDKCHEKEGSYGFTPDSKPATE